MLGPCANLPLGALRCEFLRLHAQRSLACGVVVDVVVLGDHYCLDVACAPGLVSLVETSRSAHEQSLDWGEYAGSVTGGHSFWKRTAFGSIYETAARVLVSH